VGAPGLLAKGLTELDDSDAYKSWVQRLTRDYDPVGDLEIFWVRRIAFCRTRLDRAARIEANYINAEIHPPSQEQECPTPITPELGLSTAIGALSAINLVLGFQRYETAIENKLVTELSKIKELWLSQLVFLLAFVFFGFIFFLAFICFSACPL
jgi:hypothetical protein